MNTFSNREFSLINPNWSAFVLLVTLLSSLNSLAVLTLPLADDAVTVLRLTNLAITLILWADFVYLLRRAPDRIYFMGRQHGWMVLLGSFPFFRALRIIWFRLILRADGYTLRDFMSRIAIRRNAEGTVLIVFFAVIVFFEAAVVAILSLEETAPGSNIASVSDALWWAFATVTTVGYGDKFPVTNGGRVVAVLLMAVGIALFSAITGSLAEWFRNQQPAVTLPGASRSETGNSQAVAEIRQLLEEQENAYQQTITELKDRLRELELSM